MRKHSRGVRVRSESQYFNSIDPNEAIILSFLPTKWRWIARNKNGVLVIFTKKPKKHKGDFWTLTGSITWDGAEGDRLELPYRTLFTVVKWADKEPINIDRLLKQSIHIDKENFIK